MLVLTRKLGEEVVLSNGVVVKVVEIRGKQIRLGITAPGDVSIGRPESKFFAEKQQKSEV